MLCLLKSHDMLSFISPEAEHAQTQSGKEIVGEYWRSDAMVKVWILGSLSQETLKYVVKPNKDLSTAREIWEQLRTIYGPNPLLAERRKTLLEYMGNEKEKKVGKAQAELLLYDATIAHDFLSVERILSEKVITLSEKITISGNTALHLAVATTKKNWEFLQKMLNLATKDNLKLLDVRNSQGSTLLHVAAIIGDTEAAKMLVEKDKTLLYAKDNEDQTPVAKALSRNTDTYQYLRGCSIKHRDIELGDIGHSELLVNIISSKDHKSAYSLLEKTNGLPKETDIVLMAIAQNFPPKLNFWERIVSAVPDLLKFKFVESVKRKAEAYHYAVRLLDIICTYSVRKGTTPRLYLDFFNNAILEATRQNAEEFVQLCRYNVSYNGLRKLRNLSLL
ncbi:hypothetical protein L1987_65419 [Smallanthus sonchifolius]|uniref:Uncharacterized protein n=1 Tax=Smallanthus sonchifolius TaxID=185202 RepID=A0ACB9BUE6_9ASTR|nr:hypothetical protein L1987_65419 [Smallanthus sonchifolius]